MTPEQSTQRWTTGLTAHDTMHSSKGGSCSKAEVAAQAVAAAVTSLLQFSGSGGGLGGAGDDDLTYDDGEGGSSPSSRSGSGGGMQRRWRWSILTVVKATEETQPTLTSRPQPDTHALSTRTTTQQTHRPQHQTPTGTPRPHNTYNHRTTTHHPRRLQTDPCSGKHEHTAYP